MRNERSWKNGIYTPFIHNVDVNHYHDHDLQ